MGNRVTSVIERPELLRSLVAATDPFAPVRLSPVSVNGSAVSLLGVEVERNDGAWKCISVHSQGYQLIPNALVLQATREITSRSSMSWTE